MPDGTLCGLPMPKFNYNKPEGYDSKCLWVPVNPTVLGKNINYSSIASYSFTISSLISILCNIFLVPFADFSYFRKPMIYIAAFIYSCSVFLTFFISDNALFLVNAGLLVSASVASGILNPISNTFMKKIAEGQDKSVIDKISGIGNVLGYTSVALLLPIEYAIFLSSSSITDNNFTSRIALLIVGVYMSIVYIVSFFFVQNYKEKPLDGCAGIQGVK